MKWFTRRRERLIQREMERRTEELERRVARVESEVRALRARRPQRGTA